ncbi:MAG: hypothetical protein WD844_12980 [Thermoleophilaceae bacterium]
MADGPALARTLLDKAAGDEATVRALVSNEDVPDANWAEDLIGRNA